MAQTFLTLDFLHFTEKDIDYKYLIYWYKCIQIKSYAKTTLNVTTKHDASIFLVLNAIKITKEAWIIFALFPRLELSFALLIKIFVGFEFKMTLNTVSVRFFP